MRLGAAHYLTFLLAATREERERESGLLDFLTAATRDSWILDLLETVGLLTLLARYLTFLIAATREERERESWLLDFLDSSDQTRDLLLVPCRVCVNRECVEHVPRYSTVIYTHRYAVYFCRRHVWGMEDGSEDGREDGREDGMETCWRPGALLHVPCFRQSRREREGRQHAERRAGFVARLHTHT